MTPDPTYVGRGPLPQERTDDPLLGSDTDGRKEGKKGSEDEVESHEIRFHEEGRGEGGAGR